MKAPSEQELLAAWERGGAQHPLDRALTLLGAAAPHRGRAELARLSVGARDGLLLSLRERLFGNDLRAIADCPGCGAELEIRTTTGALRAPFADAPPEGAGGEHALETDGVRVRFRLVDSHDLAALLGCADPDEARRILLDRVVIDARRDGRSIPPRDLSGVAVAEIDERLAALDPQADVVLDLSCPECERRWQAPFDVVPIVWTEVDRWARRLLAAVDTLARAYGWREADVLALSPSRRQLYLEMAAS